MTNSLMKLRDLQIDMVVLIFAEIVEEEASAMVVVVVEDGVVQEVMKVAEVTEVTEVMMVEDEVYGAGPIPLPEPLLVIPWLVLLRVQKYIAKTSE